MKCAKEGCVALAEVVPVLSFGQFDHPKRGRASLDLPIAVCWAHALPDVPTFVTVQGWGSLCYDMARRGLALPDYGSAAITFKPLAEASQAPARAANGRRN